MNSETPSRITREKGQVLIVEDDPETRRLIVRTVQSAGFQTREAPNGKIGLTMFEVAPRGFQLIISDARMPELSGIALLSHVRKQSRVPFILMTGLCETSESGAARSLGATELLVKPLDAESLLAAIVACTRVCDADSLSHEAERFCPVNLDELLLSSRLEYDFYVRSSPGSFIKIASKGEPADVRKLDAETKRLDGGLFMTIQDFVEYVEFNIRFTAIAIGNPSISKEVRVGLLKHLAESITERCYFSDLEPGILGPLREIFGEIVQLVSDNPQSLLRFCRPDGSVENRQFAQSVAVAVYATAIARKHGWTSSNTMFKIVTAGLLHDIGLRELPTEISTKERIAMTPDERRLFESHPERGRMILSSMKGLAEDVATIVHQHHERPDGTGYPQRLSGDHIHPLARLIGVVSQFVDLVLPSSERVPPISPLAAIAKIQCFTLDQTTRTFLKHLRSIFEEARKRDVA